MQAIDHALRGTRPLRRLMGFIAATLLCRHGFQQRAGRHRQFPHSGGGHHFPIGHRRLSGFLTVSRNRIESRRVVKDPAPHQTHVVRFIAITFSGEMPRTSELVFQTNRRQTTLTAVFVKTHDEAVEEAFVIIGKTVTHHPAMKFAAHEWQGHAEGRGRGTIPAHFRRQSPGTGQHQGIVWSQWWRRGDLDVRMLQRTADLHGQHIALDLRRGTGFHRRIIGIGGIETHRRTIDPIGRKRQSQTATAAADLTASDG